MSYTYKAVRRFWRSFDSLSPAQKQSAEAAFKIFKQDPFDPRLRSHKIQRLSAVAGATIFSATVEANLRVLFRVDGSVVTTLDIGTHDIYK